jgi:hypothetical protein
MQQWNQKSHRLLAGRDAMPVLVRARPPGGSPFGDMVGGDWLFCQKWRDNQKGVPRPPICPPQGGEPNRQAGNFMGNNNFIKELLPKPGLRERQLAALAHASILTYLLGVVTGPFWPCCIFPFIPAVMLAIYKRKDKWVSFHAWQAVVFQLILFIGFFFIGLPAFIFVFAKCAPGFGQNSSGCNDGSRYRSVYCPIGDGSLWIGQGYSSSDWQRHGIPHHLTPVAQMAKT